MSKRQRHYSTALVGYTNKALQESEKGFYNEIFNTLMDENDLYKLKDLMLLDLVCFDFIRIKRLQELLKKEGDTYTLQFKSGIVRKANEAAYLLNSVQVQLRNNMRELGITRKEEFKSKLGVDAEDFSTFLSKTSKVVDVNEKTDKDRNTRTSKNKDK